jgi:ankyrin repeat protein
VQSKNVACASLLHHFASRGNVRALNILFNGDHYEDKLLTEGRGQLNFTPLHMAARGGRKDACLLLLSKGEKLNLCQLKDSNNKKPADLADANNKKELAALLRAKE